MKTRRRRSVSLKYGAGPSIELKDLPTEFSKLTPKEKIKGRKVAIHLTTPEGPYTYQVMLKHNRLSFLNNDQKECIVLDIKSAIELMDYYHKVSITSCPRIPHNMFFYFLKQLGLVYGRDITLLDVSKKAIEHSDCVVAAPVFALAGYRTFYQRHGFQNEGFDDFVRQIQKMPFSEFQVAGRLQMRKDELSNHLKWLADRKLNQDLSTEVISKAVVDECKGNSKKKETNTRQAAWLANQIGLAVNRINLDFKYPSYSRRWVLKV
jgi:hypothetical protein